ncbi:MAG: hypothetical protein Q7T20_06425 [Saprospiraceae bacterium]|nr:hypothetical protein [Saprospiraceae bacterium]
MIKVRFLLLFTLLFIFQNCEEKAPTPTKPLQAELLPANAKPIDIIVRTTNSWVEQGRFYLVGICSNPTAEWQKIWLEMVPLNAAGKPVTISKHTSVIISTFSDAVPPTGRTSFYASWPISDFSETPTSYKIKAEMAIQPAPGPILVTTVLNGMKMLTPTVPGQAAVAEGAWFVSSSLSNPLPLVAQHPRLEVLVYGKDGLLWLSTVLNTEDPAFKPIYQTEKEGPMQPGEERPFSLQVYYQGLPQTLREKGIGRVDIFPFEARL